MENKIPQIGTNEFNDLASACFGGKPKQENDYTALLQPIGTRQETLEESEKEFEKLINGKGLPTKQLLEVAEHYFIVGYQTGQEKCYSKEEVLDILFSMSVDNPNDITKWFEQFKKK